MIRNNHNLFVNSAITFSLLVIGQQAAKATITVTAVDNSSGSGAYVVWNGTEIGSYGQNYYINDTTGMGFFTYTGYTPPGGYPPVTCFRMKLGGTYTVTLEHNSAGLLVVKVTSGP